ncbi:MAG: hypothetical protein LBC08_02045 [Campylobacteraceae bacterium]|nr:hypothetical protein [Campylobacteraceae bacterium]
MQIADCDGVLVFFLPIHEKIWLAESYIICQIKRLLQNSKEEKLSKQKLKSILLSSDANSSAKAIAKVFIRTVHCLPPNAKVY